MVMLMEPSVPGVAPFGNTNEGGLYGAGRFSYSTQLTASGPVDATVTTASWSDLDFDSSYSASACRW